MVISFSEFDIQNFNDNTKRKKYLFAQKVRNMCKLIKIRRNCIHTHELLHFTSMLNTDLGKWQEQKLE